jgi:dTDP-4-amino-4,6-dideoxygalactose transaminase
MPVPFYDHAKLYRSRQTELDAAIRRVLLSGRPDWGEEVPAFEGAFAEWLGVAHVVSVNSGTAALRVALKALGIGPGDEVVTVPNSDIATTSAIHSVGARAVFVDVDETTLTMDVAALQRALTPSTKAILPVDLFGHPADLPKILEIARAHGVFVVEDACLALGGAIDERRIGHFSDITCFSFAPTKHLGSLGSGGACVTADEALAERMQMIAAYGQSRSRHMQLAGTSLPLHHVTEGLNERLDEVQAAILRVKLPDLAESLATRAAQAAHYAEHLADLPIDLPQTRRRFRHAWRNYVIHTDDRNGLRAGLAERGIGTALSYAPAMHLQPVYAAMGHGPGSFPVAERSTDRLLGLPIGPHLAVDQIAEVAGAIRAVLGRA